MDDDIVNRRAEMLQYAEKVGSVTETCKKYNVPRSLFYRYKKRYQVYGRDGLVNFPPIHNTHPQMLPKDVKCQIIKLSIMNPVLGRVKLSEQLRQNGIKVSGKTIQKILKRIGMGTKSQRLEICKGRTLNKAMQRKKL